MSAVIDTVIIGAGVTGQSCVRYLAPRERVLLMDTRPNPPGADELARVFPDLRMRFGELDAAILAGCGRVVLSPGLPLDLPDLDACRAAGVPITGDLDLFAEAVRAPVVAITGTNGKSTVTTLLGEMAKAAGRRVRVGGNLGTPVLDLLGADVELYVLELSSFQLELARSFRADWATVLNVSEDHLDRYRDVAEYAEIKRRIYRDVRALAYHRGDPLTRPDDEAGAAAATFGIDAPEGRDYGLRYLDGRLVLARGHETLIAADRLRIRGLHNCVNVLAAAALAEFTGIDPQLAVRSVARFSGLPHRCEFVAEVDGRICIDDSKATNPGAVIAALEGLDPDAARNIVLIAGGRGKGLDYTQLAEACAIHARAVVLIGEQAADLRAALGPAVATECAADLPTAVRVALRRAHPGDVVLLSPACASFDMFENFEARGRCFSEAVRAAS